MRANTYVSFALLLLLAVPFIGCAAADNCAFRKDLTSTAIPAGFGVNIEFTDPQPGEIKMMSDAGLRWVRIDLKWDQTEPSKGQYDFSSYERLLAVLEEHRMRALFILDYGNPHYDNGKPPHSAVGREAFARWAVAAAKRFAGRGIIWEIYNEPNIAQFWPPQPNAQDYVALAMAVGKAFRETLPDEMLVGPATSGIDFNFLEECFKGGLLEYWSAVTVHPYRREDPETAAADYCRLRRLIATYSPVNTNGVKKEIPIISGEWGYSDVWPQLSSARQGQLLARQWLTNAANGIPLSVWYDWRDDGFDPTEPEHHFGMVFRPLKRGDDPIYNPKPAYLAARTLIEMFDGYRFEKRVDTGASDDFVLLFRQRDDIRIAAWTRSKSSHVVTIAIGAGDYQAITHTGERLDHLKLPVLTITQDPIYLAMKGSR